ncbi:MAG TPA: SRPBCC domain-containing protein [Thermoanaerobaculia bacterium]|nr:SRPBCC domain-containing protein [Thermoanaerobaculia bacterium]
MEKLRRNIFINAPRERVWDVMLADDTYRDWTSAFSPGSYYKGDWSEGSKILFLGPGPDGSGEGGMVSRIRENRLHEFISVEHLGIVQDGVEDTESAAAKAWSPAFENYTFADSGGGTELTIEMDIQAEQKEHFDKLWADALSRLKTLAER